MSTPPPVPSGVPSADTPGSLLSETAQRDLQALRAELHIRYEALESALAKPGAAGSLEHLVLDLARVATEEAEAAARHAVLDAQLEALAQTSTARAAAQRSLETQRAAAASMRASIEETKAALEQERATCAALDLDLERLQRELDTERVQAVAFRRHGDELQASLERELATTAVLHLELQGTEATLQDERTANCELRRELDDVRRALETEQAAGTVHLREAQETRLALDRERTTAKRMRQSLDDSLEKMAIQERTARAEAESLSQQAATQRAEDRASAAAAADQLSAVQRELAAARHDGGAFGVELAAATARIASLEEQRSILERARGEAEAALQATIVERDATVDRLENTRRAASAAAAETQLNLEESELRCRTLEQTRHHLEEQLQATILERDAHAADFEVVRHAARHGAFESQDEGEEISLDSGDDDEDDAIHLDADLDGDDLISVAAESRPLQPASRHAFDRPLEIRLDGVAGMLVNLSMTGAQVLSPQPLKPNHVVRLALPFAERTIACTGKIVWAQLEPSLAEESPMQFRAGLYFTSVDEEALTAYLEHHV